MGISSDLVVAYLAGAIDSDGSIGIRRSTYAVRVRADSRHATYSERVCLKQVTPQIPELLKETFGGSLMIQKPSVTKGRQMYYWESTNKGAADALLRMLPYMRIKRAQAEACLALRASKSQPRSLTHVYRDAVAQRTGTGVHMIRRMEVSPETIAERERLYLLIKSLNKVGV